MHKLLVRTITFAGSAVLFLELSFRFVLPASLWPMPFFLETGIQRFDTGSPSTGRFTYGRLCKGGFLWSINHQGWNSCCEYLDDSQRSGRPAIAILGDSYLEGFYSNVNQHVDCYLHEMYEDTVSFYTFAMSGCVLSQYIALMRYEVEQYEPSGYIIFVNAQDVEHSFSSRISQVFFHYEEDGFGGYVEVRPFEVNRPIWKNLLLQSAFVRYLRANLQLPMFGAGLADQNANFSTADSSEAVVSTQDEDRAAFLLAELNAFNRPVLIVADCPRGWVYDGTSQQSFYDVDLLRERIGEFPNVGMIELNQFYDSVYNAERQRFEYEDNPHWNSYTNRKLAEYLFGRIDHMLCSPDVLNSN